MNDVVLIIGDPLMGSEQLGGPARAVLESRFDVVSVDWDISFDQVVAANLAIEKGGPDALDAEFEGTVDNGRVVAILTQFFPLSATKLDRWPRLTTVATLRAGTENIDSGALAARGIRLVANAGRNANAVAEMAVALTLASLRAVGENHHSIRGGGWRPERPPRGHRELAGLRVGLVGLGAVGSLVLRRLSGFDVETAFFDPYVNPGDAPTRQMDLDELMARSDIVSLHARSTPDSRGLISGARLDLLPPEATLINTARAELIDETALINRLENNVLGGAGLDVFSTEPLPTDHPLRTLPTVTLSPHLAGSTVEARTSAPRRIAGRLAEALGVAVPTS